MSAFDRDLQYYKFCAYGFLKNLRFFEPFLILFFLERGMDFLQIGILYSFREIIRNIFEIPAGIIADTLGRRRTMILSFSFYLFSFLLFFLSNVYWMFFVAMFCYAFGDAFRTGTHKAMIFEYLKIKGWESLKVDYYGHTRSWSQIGSAVSSLIAGITVFITGNYEYIFLFSAVPYLLDLLLMISYPKELDGVVVREKGEGRREERVGWNSVFLSVFREFLDAVRQWSNLKALLNVSMFSAYQRAVKDYLQPVIQTFALTVPLMLAFSEQQRTAVLIGIIYFVIYLLSSMAARRSGLASKQFVSLPRYLNVLLLGGLIAGVVTGLLYGLDLSVLAILFFIGIYLIENLRKPAGVAYIAEKLPRTTLATSLSVESQVKTLFTAIIAILLGYFADRFGLGYGLVIVTGILVLVSPFVWLHRFRA